MNAVHWIPLEILAGTSATGNRNGLFVRVLAGLLLAVVATTGIYAVAATTATTATASFSDSERSSHARIVKFSLAIESAAADRRMAQVRCELIENDDKHLCNIDAKLDETRAKTQALHNYQEGVKRVSYVAMRKIGPARVDVSTGAAFDVAPRRRH